MLDKIATKIKHLRIKKGLTQQDLCSDILNRTILSHIENNKMLPNLEQLKYLSDKLGVDIRYFFSPDGKDSLTCNEAVTNYNELYVRNEYDKIINLFKKSDTVFSEENLSNLYFTGMASFNLGIKSDSLKLLRKFIFRYSKLNYDNQKKLAIEAIKSLNILFKLMLENKNYDKGIRYLSLAKKNIYLFDIIDSEISYIIHNNLAYAYFLKAKYTSVIHLLENFIKHNKKMIHSVIIADMHLTLSLSYYNKDDYTLALEHIHKSSFFYNYAERNHMAILNNLNIINIYRHNHQFQSAFSVLNDCKLNYSGNKEIYIRFQIQEAILYFDLGDYFKSVKILNSIPFRQLSSSNKKDYMLMKAHIAFINGDFKTAENYYRKCKNYYLSNNYNYDLALIYSDLLSITSNATYLDLLKSLKSKPARKNIVINS